MAAQFWMRLIVEKGHLRAASSSAIPFFRLRAGFHAYNTGHLVETNSERTSGNREQNLLSHSSCQLDRSRCIKNSIVFKLWPERTFPIGKWSELAQLYRPRPFHRGVAEDRRRYALHHVLRAEISVRDESGARVSSNLELEMFTKVMR